MSREIAGTYVLKAASDGAFQATWAARRKAGTPGICVILSTIRFFLWSSPGCDGCGFVAVRRTRLCCGLADRGEFADSPAVLRTCARWCCCNWVEVASPRVKAVFN